MTATFRHKDSISDSNASMRKLSDLVSSSPGVLSWLREQPYDQRRHQKTAQSDHIDQQPFFHRAPDIMKLQKSGLHHVLVPPKLVFLRRWVLFAAGTEKIRDA